jgi:predicted nucleic acid-binding protein
VKVYLDACALNRLTDDQSQPRIRAEAAAVEKILSLVLANRVMWMAGKILEAEILRNPDIAKRRDALELLFQAGKLLVPSEQTLERGRFLASAGYGVFDALHLAHAEEVKVDALLTTDDRFIRQAARGLGNPLIRVMNPIDLIEEVRIWLLSKQ